MRAFCVLAMFVLPASVAGCDDEPTPARKDAATDGNTGPLTLDGGFDALPVVDADHAPACTVVAPTECPDAAPRYVDVQPIFTSRCVTCHWGEPGGPWPLSSYRHIADWSAVVRAHVQLCLMPPPESGMTMPDSERRLILDWMRCGLPE